ncbi:MAG: internalin [Myxococcaceae bacterium]|nr:internalin [Myxococcaceae bacterium]
MKVRAVLAVALVAAACAPEDVYQNDLFPDSGLRDTGVRRDTGRVDVPRPPDVPGARDTGVMVDAGRADIPAGPDVPVARDVGVDRGPPVCRDEDGDGISDELEGAPFQHTALTAGSTPDYQNADCDEDGVSDADEARRNYAGFAAAARPALRCGDLADDCDGDGYINARDRDSDNDGLTDREESARTHSDPCVADTDGDGVGDLTESAAGSSPTDPASRPPAGSLYVTLPYRDRAGPQTRSFDFSTRIRSADIMFLVDTTGSMMGTIMAVRDTLSSTIVPGIVRAIGPGADMRYGMAEHRDFANGGNPGDFALRVLQRLAPDPMLSQAAAGRLTLGDGDDFPESQVPAMHALLSGFGLPQYGGTATRMVTAADCGGDATAFGWACFQPGRVPIVVLFSDASWHNGPTMPTGNFYSGVPTAAVYTQLVMEFRRREAYFVGIDVSNLVAETYNSSLSLSRDSRTLDGAGAPIAFRGSPATVAANVISAITTLAQGTRQDVTRRGVADPAETRLAAGRHTDEFMQRIVPLRGTPAAPAGFDRFDDATFFNVSPSTVVTFEVTFFNDFHRNDSGAAQLFRATIEVLGRASSVVDTIQVFVIVPAEASNTPG